MNESRLCRRLLSHLWRNSQLGLTENIIDISNSCGASVFAVLKAASALDRAGLIDARRLRLTLAGLALAASFGAAGLAGARRTGLTAERRPGRSLPRAPRAA